VAAVAARASRSTGCPYGTRVLWRGLADQRRTGVRVSLAHGASCSPASDSTVQSLIRELADLTWRSIRYSHSLLRSNYCKDPAMSWHAGKRVGLW
jgi:hypothetical protein